MLIEPVKRSIKRTLTLIEKQAIQNVLAVTYEKVEICKAIVLEGKDLGRNVKND